MYVPPLAPLNFLRQLVVACTSDTVTVPVELIVTALARSPGGPAPKRTHAV